MTIDPDRPTTIRSCADLEDLWSRIIGSGGIEARSLWISFLDSASTVMPTLVPFDDFPVVPERALLQNLRTILESLVGHNGVASIALLMSRPGPQAMTIQDRRWAVLLHEEVGCRYSDWPIHLATRGRIQVFAPDDLILAA